MNKNILIAVVIGIILALVVLAVLYAPGMVATMLRMHGLR